MRITFLGTGTSVGVPVMTCDCEVCSSPDPKNRRLRPSVCIQWGGRTILIDTATDLRQQALTHRIDRLDAVLFTHCHADHVFGFDEVRIYNYRQKASIPCFGSPSTLDSIRRTFRYAFEGAKPGGGVPQVELREVDGPFPLFDTTVIPVEVMHGRMPILGFRVGRFAYITDCSKMPETAASQLKDLDLLVLNALRRKPHPTHFSLDQAVEVVSELAPRRALLTHISHDVEHERVSRSLPVGIELAYDGLSVTVEDEEPKK